ncbi:hypothetical protein GE061_011841, partial [Apolygus lucorum]
MQARKYVVQLTCTFQVKDFDRCNIYPTFDERSFACESSHLISLHRVLPTYPPSEFGSSKESINADACRSFEDKVRNWDESNDVIEDLIQKRGKFRYEHLQVINGSMYGKISFFEKSRDMNMKDFLASKNIAVRTSFRFETVVQSLMERPLHRCCNPLPLYSPNAPLVPVVLPVVPIKKDLYDLKKFQVYQEDVELHEDLWTTFSSNILFTGICEFRKKCVPVRFVAPDGKIVLGTVLSPDVTYNERCLMGKPLDYELRKYLKSQSFFSQPHDFSNYIDFQTNGDFEMPPSTDDEGSVSSDVVLGIFDYDFDEALDEFTQRAQIQEAQLGCDILISTPANWLKLSGELGCFDYSNLEHIVFDSFEKLHKGYLPELTTIFEDLRLKNHVQAIFLSNVWGSFLVDFVNSLGETTQCIIDILQACFCYMVVPTVVIVPENWEESLSHIIINDKSNLRLLLCRDHNEVAAIKSRVDHLNGVLFVHENEDINSVTEKIELWKSSENSFLVSSDILFNKLDFVQNVNVLVSWKLNPCSRTTLIERFMSIREHPARERRNVAIYIFCSHDNLEELVFIRRVLENVKRPVILGGDLDECIASTFKERETFKTGNHCSSDIVDIFLSKLVPVDFKTSWEFETKSFLSNYFELVTTHANLDLHNLLAGAVDLVIDRSLVVDTILWCKVEGTEDAKYVTERSLKDVVLASKLVKNNPEHLSVLSKLAVDCEKQPFDEIISGRILRIDFQFSTHLGSSSIPHHLETSILEILESYLNSFRTRNMPRGRRHRSSSSRSRPRSISWSRSRSRTPRSVKKKNIGSPTTALTTSIRT